MHHELAIAHIHEPHPPSTGRVMGAHITKPDDSARRLGSGRSQMRSMFILYPRSVCDWPRFVKREYAREVLGPPGDSRHIRMIEGADTRVPFVF